MRRKAFYDEDEILREEDLEDENKPDPERDLFLAEMERAMNEPVDPNARYKSNRLEKENPLYNKYEHVIFGKDEPYLSDDISKLSSMGKYGMRFNSEMKSLAEKLGLKFGEIRDLGVDIYDEKYFTGHIEYEMRLKDYDVLVTNKWVPYLAVKPRSKYSSDL